MTPRLAHSPLPSFRVRFAVDAAAAYLWHDLTAAVTRAAFHAAIASLSTGNLARLLRSVWSLLVLPELHSFLSVTVAKNTHTGRSVAGAGAGTCGWRGLCQSALPVCCVSAPCPGVHHARTSTRMCKLRTSAGGSSHLERTRDEHSRDSASCFDRFLPAPG